MGNNKYTGFTVVITFQAIPPKGEMSHWFVLDERTDAINLANDAKKIRTALSCCVFKNGHTDNMPVYSW